MILPPVPDLVDFAGDAGPDRRRRRRHRRDAAAREGVLRRQGGRGALRRPLREAAARRSAASTSGAAPTAGSRSPGVPKSPSCRLFPHPHRSSLRKVGYRRSHPRATQVLGGEDTLTKRKLALVAILFVIVAVAATVLALGTSPGSAKPNARRSRRRGSTSARTTTAAGRRPMTRAACTCRRRSARKVQTTYKENVPEGPQVAQVIEQLVARRQQDHLRDVVRLPARRWCAAAKKYPDVKFEQATGTTQPQEPGRVLRRRRGRDLPLRHRRRRGDEDRRSSATSCRSRSPR